MQPTFSKFADAVETETAFDVLAVAKRLIAGGKKVIDLTPTNYLDSSRRTTSAR